MPNIPINRVASPVLIDADLPQDPNLRAVANDVLAKLRYSVTAAAAAEEQSAASGQIDKLVREFLATRSAPTRARARENARAIMESAPPLRQQHFGRYAAIALNDYKSVGSDNMESRVGALQVNSAALKKGLETLHKRLTVAHLEPAEPATSPQRERVKVQAGQSNPDLEAGKRFKKLRLYIREVRCIEETSDGPGSDEINLGGTIVGATGNTVLVDQFQVSDDFDAGESRDPNRVFGGYTLRTESQGFPYVYTAVVVMAEKDDGGFYKFLKELWEKVGDKVQQAVAGLVGAGVGAALGALAGPIGAVVGAVFGALIGWLISLFDNADDIVGVKTVQLGLGACTKSYYDWAKLTTAQGLKSTLFFKGDDGRYEVDLSWKVATQ
ncbi:MAG TPA: hypothetical protein VER76_14510 [Pyrinomonadaceae bacterium]|nr:hypothetical protein [Pyrinomonadaceae bacterium]